MVDHRVRQIFATRTTTQGDDLFGHYELLPPLAPLHLAPIKRVALLTESFLPKVDGVSKTSYLTVRYLQETGRDVLIFAPDSAVPQVGNSEVVNLPSFSMPAATETRVALPMPLIAQRLEAFQPDLIHLASPAFMTVAGMAMGRELNVPIVANYQTDLPGYASHYGWNIMEQPTRKWLRYIHNGCHVNLVPSQTIKRDLQGHRFRRMRVWGRGVNLERFNPAHYSATMRARLLAGRDPDALLCIYVGRLANEKSVDLLREVADVAGVALTIIGDGHSREYLEDVFAGTGTHFTGYMYKDDLATAFASADVFCFAGANETFGQVVQEAMASGLPTVVTDRGSVKDLVRDSETGFVVDHTPSAFADAARTLQNDRNLLQQMSYNARARAETRPWWAIMQELETYYHEAVALNQRFTQRYGWTNYHQPWALGTRIQHWMQQFDAYLPRPTQEGS